MVNSLIFSAPSGSGKTTIVKYILEKYPKFNFSISATTRKIRDGEIDGKDYFFISVDEFKNKIIMNEFIEWEEVYPNQFYGSLKSECEKIWSVGDIVIFDMDVIGGSKLRERMDNVISFYIHVPYEIIEERLRTRNTESEDKINIRLSKVLSEIEFKEKFDIVIDNNILENTFKNVDKIISNIDYQKGVS